MTVALLVVSILFQLGAAGMALWFIRVSGRRVGWILMATAIFLMAIRRSLSLAQVVLDDAPLPLNVWAEFLALMISLLMCVGVYHIGVFFQEIRETRSRLKSSESLYRSLFNEVSDGIVMADALGGQLHPNPSALRMFGYGVNEFSRMRAAELFVPEDLEREPLEFDSLRKGKKLFKKRRLRRKDGTIFFTEISSALLVTGQVVAVIRDVTSRVETEAALRENEAHLRAVLNSVFDAIVTLDLEGSVVECNRGAGAMFRDEVGRLLGAPMGDLIPGLDERWTEITGISEAIEDVLRWELIAEDRFGRRFPVELSITASQVEAEKRIVVAIRDLTRWKELQADLVQSQKMDALGTLAGGIAHDFNNVLMVVLGNLEMALEDIGSAHKSGPGLERAYSSARRGKALVDQILTFSRKDAFEMSSIAINEVVDEAFALLRPVIPASIQLECEIEEALPLVAGDKTQLEQVLLNLISNGYQSYEGQSGRVDVACRLISLSEPREGRFSSLLPGDYLSLTVRDFGSGIASEVREKIFDPFFTTKKAGEGTGMGLSVVLGIIDQHGGGIELDSTEGVGSCFEVLLPIAGECDQEPSETEISLVHGKGELVVLVDDQDSVLELGKKLVERSGYECVALQSGREALRYFITNRDRVSLLITDLAMPEMNGLALSREIRTLCAAVPIVLTSGNPTEVSTADLERHGVKRVLSKPFTIGELSNCLAEALVE